jgi:crotonobetainyl-CoA:carnitine CoA-transferase CaiB-like acyl-CoA transferase
MVGLWDAQRSGIGRDIDIALMDTAVSMLSYMAIWSLNRDWEPTRVGQAGHQTLVPAQNFRTRDGWVVIFCSKEKFWANLAEGIGRPELASDPRFRTFPDRMANKPALLAILEPILRERTTAEWLVRLRGRVPCSPVNSIREALADEQTRARDMIVEVAHPVWGALREVACPIKTAGEIRRPAPAPGLGEHTEPLLRDTLGYSADRVAALRACGAIGPAPR